MHQDSDFRRSIHSISDPSSGTAPRPLPRCEVASGAIRCGLLKHPPTYANEGCKEEHVPQLPRQATIVQVANPPSRALSYSSTSNLIAVGGGSPAILTKRIFRKSALPVRSPSAPQESARYLRTRVGVGRSEVDIDSSARYLLSGNRPSQ